MVDLLTDVKRVNFQFVPTGLSYSGINVIHYSVTTVSVSFHGGCRILSNILLISFSASSESLLVYQNNNDDGGCSFIMASIYKRYKKYSYYFKPEVTEIVFYYLFRLVMLKWFLKI